MKKLLAVLLAAASAALCVGLSACGNGEETVQGQEEVLLYDFEDYDRNFQLMRVMSYFGAVDKNEQAQYVKSGTASALLRPLGWHSTMINNTYTGIKAESCLYIPLSSVRYDFDYTDASKLEQISFSMYNAEEEDLSLYLGLIFEKNATEVSDLTEFALKPGWNDVFYLLDHDVLALNYDLSSCFGLAMTFDRVGSHELADAPMLYLDDIRIRTLAEPVQTQDFIQLDEGEICDFEKLYQTYMVKSDMYDKALRPDIDIVTASDYGITAPSGSKVLRVAMKPKNMIDGTIYDKVYLTESLVAAAGLDTASEDARIVFWVYNDCDIMLDLPFTVENSRTSGYYVAKHIYANPKQWTRVSVPLADIDAYWGGEEDSFTLNPGALRIEWGEVTGETERVVSGANCHIEQ